MSAKKLSCSIIFVFVIISIISDFNRSYVEGFLFNSRLSLSSSANLKLPQCRKWALPSEKGQLDILGQTDKTTETPTEEQSEDEHFPRCYVVISNLQSGSNIGSICRNALAFNVAEVVVVGRRNFRDKMRQADRGAKQRQIFTHFNSVAEAATYLKDEKNCTIFGIEIMDDAVPVTSQPFTHNTAFMFGNEGGGLSDRQRAACDKFVYIPQYASGGMASINVACASAIVFQTFAVWAQYRETIRIGEKFV